MSFRRVAMIIAGLGFKMRHSYFNARDCSSQIAETMVHAFTSLVWVCRGRGRDFNCLPSLSVIAPNSPSTSENTMESFVSSRCHNYRRNLNDEERNRFEETVNVTEEKPSFSRSWSGYFLVSITDQKNFPENFRKLPQLLYVLRSSRIK